MAVGLHSNAAGTDLHEDKRIKQPVRAVAVANLSLTTPGSTLDGVSLLSGDRILLTAQSTASQNGIYTWTGASTTLTRTSDATLASDFVYGFKTYVREGTLYTGTYWTYTQSATVTIGTTALTFAQDATSLGNQAVNVVYAGPSSGSSAPPAFRALVSADLPSSPTVTGELTAADFKITGLTGATAGGRFVGVTASGAPASGTFAVGDFIFDLTPKIYICTGAGSPGTWVQASGSMNNPMTTNQDMIVGVSTGTPTRLGVGANGQVLGITSGVIGWVNNPSGFSNPMTTLGDLLYGGTSGSPTRLPNGANGQVLTMVGGLPGWANATGGGGGGSGVSDALYLAKNCI